MRILIDAIARINRLVCNLGIVLACGLLLLMTSAVLLQVASREMRAPIGWTEEVALASMVWVAFLVGPWAYRNHQFTRIDVVVENLSLRKRAGLNVVIHIMEAVILIGAVYFSWRFFLGGSSVLPAITRLVRDILGPFLDPEVVNSIRVRNKYIYVILPVGFAALLMVTVEHFLRAVLTVATGLEQRVGTDPADAEAVGTVADRTGMNDSASSDTDSTGR